MSGPAIAVLLVILLPMLAFGVWQLLQEALVRVDSGTVGLLIVRGKASERTLVPGVHFVWPFRQQMIQGYPLRDLTYLTADDAVEASDFSDPPLHARLGDRTRVAVCYTVRFRIRPDDLYGIHERVGPDGIKRLVRDVSRQVIIEELAGEAYGLDHAFASARQELEQALIARLTERFREHGFDVAMFNLRTIDLGPVNDVIDATVRAKAELELERVAAVTRNLRVKNEAATSTQLAKTLTDRVLRYRQLELGREALQRWDGRIVINDPSVVRGVIRDVPANETDDQPAAPTAAPEASEAAASSEQQSEETQ
jgi:regulator of protease activity HflC (stomatin/prohibitin superfamily)